MSLASAIMAEINKQAKTQGVKDLCVEAFQLNAIYQGATKIIEGFNQEKRESSESMGLSRWLASHDTGLSSKAMAHHICGAPADDQWGNDRHPLDPSDFGRCHRFLLAVPEARANLPKMEGVSEVWGKLVREWDALTALYLEELPTGKCPKLYDRMKELGC